MPGKDHKKELKALYTGRKGRVDEVDVPPLDYLMLDGVGDPSTAIGPAIGALYSVAYPLKFAIKARDAKLDYVVMPPEALYTGPRKLYEGPREKWRWTMLVMQPVKPTAAELAAVKASAIEKGAPPGVKDVRLERLSEGRSVQSLHVGPYAREHETVALLMTYMEAHGLEYGGAHHEVYLSDPQRAAPEKLKTIIRVPVTAKKVAHAVAAR